MSSGFTILAGTAVTIGFIHTLFGPDHYLPFIVMSKARGWSIAKTSLITFLCGLGHVASSVVLGFIGIALGVAISKLEFIESSRGEVAAWLFIAFGFTYFIWGLHKAIRNRPHRHLHRHAGEDSHSHVHRHNEEHTHVHTRAGAKSLTPWVLFTIFIFGPCEPLIPILMYPAAKGSMISVIAIASIFGVVTISTMMGIVLISSFGLSRLPLGRIERYSHALAGLTIFLCGGAIKFLGL